MDMWHIVATGNKLMVQPTRVMTTSLQEGCKPRPTCVTLDLPRQDPNEIYYPTKIEVDRCGGCCNHEALSCKPITTFNVVKMIKVSIKISVF